MLRLKRFPRILTSFYIIGYIFAFFALFYQTKLLFAIITFAASGFLHLLHIRSNEYRSAKYLIRAKKLIDKGEIEKAVENILISARIQPNEEILVQINATVKKNTDYYGATAELLSQKFTEFDSPFVRFVAAGFFYTAKKMEKSKEMLIDIPLDKMSVKALRLLGSVLYDLGDYSKAHKVFLAYTPPAIPMKEDDMAILYGIAICHIAKKESKKAIEYLNRVKSKSPKYGNAERLITQLTAELNSN